MESESASWPENCTMRAILLLLSVITISCQKVNHNSTATHVLPVPLAQNGGGVEGEGEQPPFVGEGKGSPISFEGTGGTGTSSNSGPTRSRIVETKYGKVQGISVTIAQGRHNPLKNKIVEVRGRERKSIWLVEWIMGEMHS